MEIDKLIEGADIVRFIKAQRIKWLGLIQRMDPSRPIRKPLSCKPMGTRPVGRPRQRWQEDVMEDLKKLKIKKKKQQVLSTIVLMLDVITSFNFLFFPNYGLKK
jgi:hypothetical protein